MFIVGCILILVFLYLFIDGLKKDIEEYRSEQSYYPVEYFLLENSNSEHYMQSVSGSDIKSPKETARILKNGDCDVFWNYKIPRVVMYFPEHKNIDSIFSLIGSAIVGFLMYGLAFLLPGILLILGKLE